MLIAGMLLLAILAEDPPAPAPPRTEVSPLVVTAPPKTAPPAADATVVVGSDQDNLQSQGVSIWPTAAREAGLSGRVILRCKVDVHGLAESCAIAYESPPGRGFGGAALALRPLLKLTPRTGPDGPTEATMNIAINFDRQETQSNLREVMARAAGPGGVPPESGGALAREGVGETNARDLVVYHNPVATRRVTMMDSAAWVQAPTFEDLAAAYPSEGAGLEGYAVAHCKAERTGVLSRCAVAKEVPVGHGFGKAVLGLAPRFRISPEAMAQAPQGAPVEVDVPVRFPSAAEAKDRTVRAPVWVAGADPQSQMRDFPTAVAKKDSPGAVVQCRVGTGGALTACAIELTSPDGLDFDDAAVKLASRLKMNLWSAEAGPVEGGVVHLPVNLALAGPQ
jgi:TonB family protein